MLLLGVTKENIWDAWDQAPVGNMQSKCLAHCILSLPLSLTLSLSLSPQHQLFRVDIPITMFELCLQLKHPENI